MVPDMAARLSSLLLAALVCGCSIDPAIPPRMLRDIEQTTPACRASDQCTARMLAAKRWILQRADLWGLGSQITDERVLPKADTMISLADRQIILLDWRRMPGAYFAYWITDATIYGAALEPGRNGEQVRLHYVTNFRGKSYHHTSTDYDARMSWGRTVLAFNRYVSKGQAGEAADTSKRAEAARRIHRLERTPLGSRADADRRWLMAWLIDDPVLGRAHYCIDALGPSWQLTYRYAKQIEAQLLFSSLAAVLQRPGLRTGREEVIAAGLRGALMAYQAILKEESGAAQSSLDRLLERNRHGELEAYLATLAFVKDPDDCAERAG